MTPWELAVVKDKIRQENAKEELSTRQWSARLYAMRKERAQHKIDYSRGYCPVCHMLRALDGSCSC